MQRQSSSPRTSSCFSFATKTLICTVAVLFSFALPGSAVEVTKEYLDREYDWAMSFEATPVSEYFNYKGSKLHPLTKIRVSVQKSLRSRSRQDEVKEYVYEDFWYFNGKSIGMHRKHALDIRKDLVGALIIRPTGGKACQALSATNAALRALVELQLAKLATNTLFVAEEDYEEIANAMSEFGFYRGMTPSSGKQLGLDLRRYPSGREERFYFLAR